MPLHAALTLPLYGRLVLLESLRLVLLGALKFGGEGNCGHTTVWVLLGKQKCLDRAMGTRRWHSFDAHVLVSLGATASMPTRHGGILNAGGGGGGAHLVPAWWGVAICKNNY